MRRLMMATGLVVVLTLSVASVAVAQSFTDPNPQVGQTCPPGTAAFGDPGTGQLACLTQEDLAALESGQQVNPPMLTAGGNGTAAAAQYDAGTAPAALSGMLPDTGGLPLALVAGVMLIGIGLLIRKS